MREQDFLKLLTHLNQKIQAESATFGGMLLAGRVQSFEEYRHYTGVIRGLDIAINLIREVAKYDDDEDES